MRREFIKDVLKRKDFGTEITVAGWVRTRRDSKGGFSFIELNDGSCFGNIQILAENSLHNYTSEIVKLLTGASVSVKGKLVESPGKGQSVEIHALAVKVLGFCKQEDGYPLQKQRVPFEKLREVAHLRPRTNSFGAMLRIRNRLAYATHKFYQERNFYYLNTPVITCSDCEGAGEMFQVTTLDLNNLPKTVNNKIDYSQDFFGRKASLTVSGQLEAESYACALGNVYTFGPTFRAENSNTRRHLSEFWMIEPEMAFADIDDNVRLAEDYVRYLTSDILEHCSEDLDFFNKRIQKGLIERLTKVSEAVFKTINYSNAIDILIKSGKTFEYPVKWGIDLQSEHEKFLTEEYFKAPVTVVNYPKNIKAFYMRLNDDNETVAAIDMLVPGIGEIIGGSQREERLDVLQNRIRELGQPIENYWWYLDLRKFGTVPHAGFGLGFERLIQFCTGMQNIRDVIPFPRTPNNADF
ncbi:MAG: asparagine--tRNA ligase [Victivallales bacterium]|nr:asparagine--tRNA ligase [Victivallales bacterium]MCF7888657.1 asparagine--tRNA ligase [Victivallales bacterium]